MLGNLYKSVRLSSTKSSAFSLKAKFKGRVHITKKYMEGLSVEYAPVPQSDLTFPSENIEFELFKRNDKEVSEAVFQCT